MLCLVRYSFLLISVCSISSSLTATNMKVTPLIGTAGNKIMTHGCSTDIIPQDGVYMYKQEGESNPQKLFYFYKTGQVDYKTVNRSKVSIAGEFPNFTITFLNLTVNDSGLYWCEFNLEEKIAVGKFFTWLWIVEEKQEETKRKDETEQKECPEHENLHEKTVLYVCIVILCIVGVFFVILVVKRCFGNRTYAPSNPASDSIYEEMKRSNLDDKNKVQIFINPDYQSTKLMFGKPVGLG